MLEDSAAMIRLEDKQRPDRRRSGIYYYSRMARHGSPPILAAHEPLMISLLPGASGRRRAGVLTTFGAT